MWWPKFVVEILLDPLPSSKCFPFLYSNLNHKFMYNNSPRTQHTSSSTSCYNFKKIIMFHVCEFLSREYLFSYFYNEKGKFVILCMSTSWNKSDPMCVIFREGVQHLSLIVRWWLIFKFLIMVVKRVELLLWKPMQGGKR